MTEMNDNDFMSMGALPQQSAEMSDDAFMSMGAKQPVNTASDIGKTLIGNVAPNAAANYAANLASVPYAVGSYATQLGTKAGEYAGELPQYLYQKATGDYVKSQADYDQEQKDLMNAVRGKMGLQPTDSGDISQLVPTPSNLVGVAAKAIGEPLYQPKTMAGQQIEGLGNIASGGLGAGIKAIPALMGAVGGTELPLMGKQAGATPAEQYLMGLAGGLGGAKIGSMPQEVSPIANAENVATNTLMGQKQQPIARTSDSLRAQAQQAYANSKELGATFNEDASTQIPQDIQKNLLTTGKMNDRLHGDTMSVLNDMKNSANNGNLNLEDLHQYRQLFSDVINKNLHPNGKMMPDAMKANQAINTIDDFLDNAQKNPDQIVSGSPESIQAWQNGQDLWAVSNRVNDIERIMQRAELMQNPATAMRQGFATLASNPKRLRGFTPEQQDLIKDASQTNLGGEALRAIASRLVSIASFGAAHNPLTGLAAIPISAAARNLSTRQQAARGQNIINNISEGIPQEYTPLTPQSKPSPLQLPPPSINVPAEGFGAQPTSSLDIVPQTRAQSSNALPPPHEMSYDDMVRSGRILQSPQNTAINLPQGAPRRIFNPNDLNAGDEPPFPRVPMVADENGNVPIPAGKSPLQWSENGAPYRTAESQASLPQSTFTSVAPTKARQQAQLSAAREAMVDAGIDRSRMKVANGQMTIDNPTHAESVHIQDAIDAQHNQYLKRSQAGQAAMQTRAANAAGKDPTSYTNFLSYLADNGGIKNEGGGERISNLGLGRNVPVGLINSKGMTHDAALQRAIEGRWIPDKGNDPNSESQNEFGDLYDLIGRGNQPHPEAAEKQATARDYSDNLRQEAASRGIAHENLTDTQVEEELNAHRAIDASHTDFDNRLQEEKSHAHETIPLAAYEENYDNGIQGNERLAPHAENTGIGKEAVAGNPQGNRNPSSTFEQVKNVKGSTHQGILGGMEQSAKQAAQARGSKITTKTAQEPANEGLFAPHRDENGFLFASGGRIPPYTHKTWASLVRQYGKAAKVKMSQLKDESARQRLLNTAARLHSKAT